MGDVGAGSGVDVRSVFAARWRAAWEDGWPDRLARAGLWLALPLPLAAPFVTEAMRPEAFSFVALIAATLVVALPVLHAPPAAEQAAADRWTAGAALASAAQGATVALVATPFLLAAALLADRERAVWSALAATAGLLVAALPAGALAALVAARPARRPHRVVALVAAAALLLGPVLPLAVAGWLQSRGDPPASMGFMVSRPFESPPALECTARWLLPPAPETYWREFLAGIEDAGSQPGLLDDRLSPVDRAAAWFTWVSAASPYVPVAYAGSVVSGGTSAPDGGVLGQIDGETRAYLQPGTAFCDSGASNLPRVALFTLLVTAGLGLAARRRHPGESRSDQA